jgi:hypothetical protein
MSRIGGRTPVFTYYPPLNPGPEEFLAYQQIPLLVMVPMYRKGGFKRFCKWPDPDPEPENKTALERILEPLVRRSREGQGNPISDTSRSAG